MVRSLSEPLVLFPKVVPAENAKSVVGYLQVVRDPLVIGQFFPPTSGNSSIPMTSSDDIITGQEIRLSQSQANMKNFCWSRPFVDVMNIVNKCGKPVLVYCSSMASAVKSSLLKYCRNLGINGKLEAWGLLFALQGGMMSTMGNPFDKLLQFISTGEPIEESLVRFGEKTDSMLLVSIMWIGIFFLSFLFSVMFAQSLSFCMVANILSAILLSTYILQVWSAMSGVSVMCGNVKMPGILFVSGAAISIMLFLGFIVLIITGIMIGCSRRRRSSPVNEVGDELV